MKLKPSASIRVKANLLTRTDEILQNAFHSDFDKHKKNYDNVKTAIFYLNTNNGKTIFEDGTRVESIANRLVTFDSNVNHTGTTCTDKIFRSVINVVYVPGPTKKELRE